MKISIIMPVYNKQQYIRIILSQILKQSFRDFECIIIDDGSTDKSGDICDEFSQADNRFKVLHIPNGGVSNARNLGIEKSTGDYITFIDSDDEIDIHYLENLYLKSQISKADIVISGYTKFWSGLSQTEKCVLPYDNGTYLWKDIISEFAVVQKNTGVYGCCTAKLISSDIVKKIRFDTSIILAEDFDFYLKIYSRLKEIYVDNETHYYYRQEADNSTSLVSDENIDYYSQLRIHLRYKEFLIEMQAYYGSNQKIVESNICNYCFFCILYSKLNEIQNVCEKMNQLLENQPLKNLGHGMLHKSIIWFYNNRQYKSIEKLLYIRSKLRNLLRRG